LLNYYFVIHSTVTKIEIRRLTYINQLNKIYNENFKQQSNIEYLK